MDEQGNIIIYQSEDGVIRLDVRLEEKTVWLTQQQMADLFGSSRTGLPCLCIPVCRHSSTSPV